MKLALVYMMCLMNLMAYAQLKYDANWCFGKGAGIYFSDTGATTFACKTYNFEPNATISSRNGKLLLYVENTGLIYFHSIRDSNNQVIQSGDSINILNSCTSGALFLPIGDNDSIFYLFHLSANPDSIGPHTIQSLLLTKVANTEHGLVVTDKNNILIPSNLTEKMAAVKHSNSTDWWIYLHLAGCNSTYLTIKVMEDGTILGPFQQNVGTSFCSGGFFGEMTISPDGNYLASTLNGLGKIDLFAIDRCTGLLTLLRSINHGNSIQTYGCAFSDNSRKLYMSSWEGSTTGESSLYQYNLDSLGFSGGLIFLSSISSPAQEYGQLELGPDGKIYLGDRGFSALPNDTPSTKCLSVINSPNEFGLGCNFQQFSFCFTDTAKISWGLPNMPNYNLGPSGVFAARAGNSDTLCGSGGSVTLGVPQQPNILYQWQTNPTLSSTTIAQPTATPTQDTWYYLTVTDTTATDCAVNTDSVFVKVEDCVGIEEPETYNIQVYPNPANHTVILNLIQDLRDETTFTLYNLLGEQVLSEPINQSNTSIPLNVPEGVYIYKIFVNNNLKRTDKLVVVE